MSLYAALLPSAAICMVCIAEPAWAETKVFNVPAQSAAFGIRQFARQANVQILVSARDAEGKRTNAVRGSYAEPEALEILLADTGLSAQATGPRTYILVSAAEQVAGPDDGGAALISDDTGIRQDDIIVTATKREQNVRDVAGSVTAFTGDELDELGAESFADYLTRTPGVQFNAATPGISPVTIRGVATTTTLDAGQGTTGVYINGIPLTEPFFAVGIPDIDVFDVQRVEILRGPQGTLFGSATLGGAINYIAATADLNEYAARVEGSLSTTAESDGIGYTAKAMVNVPIVTDRLAVRLVATHREQPGFIDNIGTGREDVNNVTVRGVRLSVEWQPTDRIRVSGLSLLSQTESKGSAAEFTRVGPFQQSTVVPEPFKVKTEVYSLGADVDLDFATLSLNAARTNKAQDILIDQSFGLGPFFRGRVPFVTVSQSAEAQTDVFEARLTSPSGRRLEWLIGVSRSDYTERFPNVLFAPNAAAAIEEFFSGAFGPGAGARLAPGDVFFESAIDVDGSEMAAFGEATFRFTDALRLTAGGRLFNTEIFTRTTQTGLFNFFSTRQVTTIREEDQGSSGFIPKVSIAYEPNDDQLYYALVSQGFRFGGPNVAPPSIEFPSPETFESDSLTNYEIGARTSWFDRQLLLDVSAFYIDWRDIQVRQSRPDFFGFATNAGRARNIGVEATASWRPNEHFDLQSSVGYLDATLREDIPEFSAIITKGSTLPGASRWRVASVATYRWGGVYEPSVSLSHRYVSSAPGNLANTIRQGGYNIFDLRARLRLGQGRVEGFVNNIANARGITQAGGTTAAGARYYVLPRTVGVRFTHDF